MGVLSKMQNGSLGSSVAIRLDWVGLEEGGGRNEASLSAEETKKKLLSVP